EGYFKEHGMIEIYASDPEFALACGVPWAVQNVASYQANRAVGDDCQDVPVAHYHYGYRVDDASGRVLPVDDITQTEDLSHHHMFDNPFAIPPVIVTASDELERNKIKALHQHETQMN